MNLQRKPPEIPSRNSRAVVRPQPLYIGFRLEQGPVFLLNSPQENFRCGPPKPKRRRRATHLPKLRVAFLPSSFPSFHPLALVFSTCPPVSVCGTVTWRLTLRAFLGRRFIENPPKMGLRESQLSLPTTLLRHPSEPPGRGGILTPLPFGYAH